MTELLEVEGVSVSFGGVRAVQDVSLTVPDDGRVAVIGPNGAGKSTLLKIIAGALPQDAGDVRFAGRSMGRRSASSRARLRIGRTFQNLELFLSLSVLDNVRAALDAETTLVGALTGRGARHRQRALAALDLFGIADHADVPAGALPYGMRKLVELSRALVTEPRLLLLDEPVAGLADSSEFVATLHDALGRRECAVLLVEHDMPTVQRLCTEVHVMDTGRRIAHGSYAEVAADPLVIEAYLGAPAGAATTPEQ